MLEWFQFSCYSTVIQLFENFGSDIIYYCLFELGAVKSCHFHFVKKRDVANTIFKYAFICLLVSTYNRASGKWNL